MTVQDEAKQVQDEAKKVAGRKVIEEFVRDGMKLGLGSGTTSHFFVRELGKHVAAGLKVTCTTTSRATNDVAREVGIKITDPNEIGELDLTVDGPDEIDRQFRMIKGGGACLLWEKIVAHASKQMITICDETKIVDQLGGFPLPVEVVQFAWKQTERMVSRLLADHGIADAVISRRMRDGQPVVTDSGNFILDCRCGVIPQPEQLEINLNQIPGVVENGLFTRESQGMVVGCFDGTAYVAMR
jgi:ribose 5-phosphate isomerase A